MKEYVFNGKLLESIVAEAEGISDYNSIRFWVKEKEIAFNDIKMVIYQEPDEAEVSLEELLEEIDKADIFLVDDSPYLNDVNISGNDECLICTSWEGDNLLWEVEIFCSSVTKIVKRDDLYIIYSDNQEATKLSLFKISSL